jgi:hypothetical protein
MCKYYTHRSRLNIVLSKPSLYVIIIIISLLSDILATAFTDISISYLLISNLIILATKPMRIFYIYLKYVS